MMNIKTLNKISDKGLNLFENDKFTVNNENEADAIILRSFDMHGFKLDKETKCIARAGAGVNNIPIPEYTNEGVVVFNTPGANANAVKELVLAALFMSSRDIVGGIEWAKTLSGEDVPKQVEAGKGAFAGPEIDGKTIGVIGLGAIGALVANRAYTLGMNVYGYDPFISVDSAWSLSKHIKKAGSLEDIFKECDYITLHIPLNDSSRGFINKESISKMKKGVRLLNFSRGELVCDQDLLSAIDNGDISCYVTDFPNANILNKKGIITIPHLGASTPESEENSAHMAARQVRDFLLYGNIKNSVNFPEAEMPVTGHTRITITHKNIPNMVGRFTGMLADNNINITNMLNKSRNDIAYTIIDTDEDVNVGIIKNIENVDGVIRVREIDY